MVYRRIYLVTPHYHQLSFSLQYWKSNSTKVSTNSALDVKRSPSFFGSAKNLHWFFFFQLEERRDQRLLRLSQRPDKRDPSWTCRKSWASCSKWNTSWNQTGPKTIKTSRKSAKTSSCAWDSSLMEKEATTKKQGGEALLKQFGKLIVINQNQSKSS